MIVTLIAAVARNGVIGNANQLLWHLPEDMAHFREATRGHPVLMGRKTWESLPERFRPLPGRRNLVLSRQAVYQARGADVFTTVPAALDALRTNGANRVFVIGGEQLYRLAMPWADELILTELDRDYQGDARFPSWPKDEFFEISRQQALQAPADGPNYDFVVYRRHAAVSTTASGATSR